MDASEFGAGTRGRPSVKVVLVAVIAMILMYVGSGCGSSGHLPAQASPSATAATLKIRKVHDVDYGFRMAYPAGWVGTRYANPSPSAQDGTLLYVVAYADPEGAQADGSYLDSMQVAVYALDRPMAPDDLTLESASTLIYRVILKDMTSMSPRSNVELVKVGGVPAWQVGYEYEVGGEVVSARSALVVKGKRAYWLTAQAGTYTWRTVAPTLDTCVRFFRIDRGQ